MYVINRECDRRFSACTALHSKRLIFIFLAMHMASLCVVFALAGCCRFIIAYYYFPLVLVVIFQVWREVAFFPITHLAYSIFAKNLLSPTLLAAYNGAKRRTAVFSFFLSHIFVSITAQQHTESRFGGLNGKNRNEELSRMCGGQKKEIIIRWFIPSLHISCTVSNIMIIYSRRAFIHFSYRLVIHTHQRAHHTLDVDAPTVE